MGATILIVEDDAAQREMLLGCLEEAGYDCIGVEDGVGALAVLAGPRPPDALVLDLVLPRLNGHELLQELAARGERHLPVVVVSGFGPVSRFSERLPLVRAVVQKPLELRALLDAVQSCIRRPSTELAPS